MSATFQLEGRSPSSTLLRFDHEGLRPELECYGICEKGWDHFLKHSLKNYAETGQSEPFAGGTESGSR